MSPLRVKRVENSESWIVSGRGELLLSILIENMRREGFELQVSKPKPILKKLMVKVVLKKPRVFSLDTALDYINSDELVEVTPVDFRLRKMILNTSERKKYDSRVKNQ